jgi:hypothetical protein
MLRARERDLTPCSSVVFTSDSHLNLSGSSGARHYVSMHNGPSNPKMMGLGNYATMGSTLVVQQWVLTIALQL